MMRSVSGTGSAGSRRSDPGGSGELSRFSVATTASSDGGGRGISFLDAFRSCFVPPEARSPENSMSDESQPSHQRTYANALLSTHFSTAFVLSGSFLSPRWCFFARKSLSFLCSILETTYCSLCTNARKVPL